MVRDSSSERPIHILLLKGYSVTTRVGSARQAKPVVVVAADKNGRTSRLHILDSLLKIHDDILKRFKGRKIVISMSWILTFLSDPENPEYRMDTFDYHLIENISHLLGLLGQLGATFVIPGGSIHWEDGLKKLNREEFDPFITVGGVDMVSWDAYYQTHINLRISAPAVDVLVPLPSLSFNNKQIGPARAASHVQGDYGNVKGTAYGKHSFDT
ncbi:hypothetical protein TWF281_008552 [Arthrobotrys megalospora]